MNRDQRKTHRIVRNRNGFSAPLFASTPTNRYVYASYIDEPVVRKAAGTSGTIHYYHRNQQYSITAMTTSTGAVAERYAYTAYGQPTICNASGSPIGNQQSQIANRYTYTGREWDETLGLHHFRARWMSPLAGRFLGRDPIGYEGSPWELYEFVYSKPLVFADPDGLAGSICGSPYPWGIYPVSLPKILPGVGRPNSKTLLGFNRGCFLNCRAKEDRVTGSAPMLPPGVVVPIGPSGGNNTTQNFPTNPPSKVGGGGCAPCVVVVIKCGTTVTVFHFLAGIDDPIETLRPYDWSGCKAMVCGGDDEGQSNCTADSAINAIRNKGISLELVSGASSCGVDENGDWYEK